MTGDPSWASPPGASGLPSASTRRAPPSTRAIWRAAVAAAEEALREADEAPPPGIVEVIEPARPLLTRVFATYVGPIQRPANPGARADEIARQRLGDRERALLRRVDGNRTLEELFDGSGLGSTDALRVVARLIRSGASPHRLNATPSRSAQADANVIVRTR